jgi:Na+/proline symporter
VPLLDRPAIAGAALAYFGLMLGIGWWAARRTRTSRDFFIAGQSIGLLVTGLATTSAAFSGFVFLGGPGLTYRLGVGSFFIVLSVGFTSALLCWAVAKRLRLLAEVREVYTIPDAMAARYRSRGAAGLAAVAVLIGTVAYLGAQLRALGVLIEAIFGTRQYLGEGSLAVAVGVGVALVLGYAVAGGMVAGVYTDVLQGILMMAAAVAVFAYALELGGAGEGLEGIAGAIASSEAFGERFLDPLGTVPAATAFGFLFVFSIGVLGQPQMLHKFYMLRDPRQLRWLPLVIAVSQSLCVLIWLGLGLAVPALVARGELPPLADPDHAAPAFLLGFVPEAVAALAFTAVLAAIMSTADSFVNLGSAALVRDLPRALGRPLANELAWGRAAVVGLALAAAGVAYAYADLIALLGTFAFGTFGAALAPALAVGLNWRRVTAAAAIASMATGMALSLGLELLGQGFLPALDVLPEEVLPGAVALAGSFTVLFLVTWWTGRPEGDDLDDDVAAVMET